MKEEKLSLLQRCIKWREANIKEKQFILILSFCRYLYSVCRINIEILYPSDTEFPDR